MLKKVMNWTKEHKESIKAALMGGAIVMVGVAYYSKCFDMGWKARGEFDKAEFGKQ